MKGKYILFYYILPFLAGFGGMFSITLSNLNLKILSLSTCFVLAFGSMGYADRYRLGQLNEQVKE